MLLGGFAKAVPCSHCAAGGVLCMKVVGKAIKPFRASFCTLFLQCYCEYISEDPYESVVGT
jgi:hypothetical protein